MKNILLIQTGGTIAMHIDKQKPELNPERWSELLQDEIPELAGLARLSAEKIFFEDSSDINRYHWKTLAETIRQRYDSYDGFVILHGTDTLAYTASALSFALRQISKPVILTGSQVPMSNIRSDARRNLVNAVELATHPIFEVAVCFNDHLYRGNRSTKMSIGDFDAFASPNHPPLAEVGLEIEIHQARNKSNKALKLYPDFDDSIYLLKLHPNLSPSLLDSLPLNRLKAVIIEAFGSGNFPVHGDYNLLPFMKKCRNQNLELIITSQAAYDAVDLTLYKSGQAALELGAVSAGDMTTEATITKSMHLLGKGVAGDEFKTQFETNLAGERTQ